MSAFDSAFQLLCDHAREVQKLQSALDLLEWDEQTKLPPAGGAYRAEQTAYLARLVHEKQTEPQVGQWLQTLSSSPLAADPHSDSGAIIRLAQRDYDKKTRLPGSLVEELARLRVLGQQTWSEARQQNQFAHFQPVLEQIIRLKVQEASAYGFEQTPYDPLLDDYEPGAKSSEIAQVLSNLRDELTPLAQKIFESPRQPDASILTQSFPIDVQRTFGRMAARAIGFDFRAGRLDTAVHPFCARVGPCDVRMTTRYDEHNFIDALFSTLHEAGHGIYEQGLPQEFYGLPTGEYASLAIHESQSRMWENQVARSSSFWAHFYPHAQAAFPGALGHVDASDFFGAVNAVRASLIRVDADEVTYNLHILIRFELELALLEDRLPVSDLPSAWNEKYRKYLGIEPPDDASGVLQDVHWSAGLFGYFPTYALGNLYAAQFFAQAGEVLGDLEEQFRQGRFTPLRDWLRQQIHGHGRRFSPAELVERITGGQLSHKALMTHLSDKFSVLYDL